MKFKHKIQTLSAYPMWVNQAMIILTLGGTMATINAAESYWLGTTSNDWNVDANWSDGAGPDGKFALINTSDPRPATIISDITAAPVDISIGAGEGTSGILNHPSGVGMTGIGNWMIVSKFGGTGVYNLANTGVVGTGITGFGQGSGRMNVSGRFLVGEGGGANGTVNINTSDGLYIGARMIVGLGSPAVMNLENGAITIGQEPVIFGQGSAGTLNMVGGSITKSGAENFIFGAQGGSGVGNISGGEINSNTLVQIGQDVGSSGELNLSGGEIISIAGDVGADGASGIANLSGVGTWSISALNPAALVDSDNFSIGGSEDAAITGTTGKIIMTGDSMLKVASRFFLGDGTDSVGELIVGGNAVVDHSVAYISIGRRLSSKGTLTVKENGRFIHADGDLNVSDAVTTSGTIDLSGEGRIDCNSLSGTYVGKRGTGMINQTGGVFNTVNRVSIGRSATGIGVINVSGGNFNQTSPDSFFSIGLEGGNGTLNISGTGTVEVAGIEGVRMSDRDTGVAVVNLDGGTLITPRIQPGGGVGQSTFNFNGGLLRAAPSANVAFLGGLTQAMIKNGGANIDSNGQDLEIAQAFLADSADGGLTKLGDGKLTLSGANTYTGNTTVIAGVLSLSSAYLADGATLTIGNATASPAVLDLPNSGTDTVGSLVIDGATVSAGTWGRIGSIADLGATAETDAITGDGLILVPEATGNAFNAWINGPGGFFPGETDPLIVGPNADPDQDGQSNLYEFALGGIPNDGGKNAEAYEILADGSSDPDTQSEFLLTIAVRNGTPNLTGSPSPTASYEGAVYTVQGSLDLASFGQIMTPVATVLPSAPNNVAPSGYEFRTFSLNGSNGLAGKGFARVQISE